MLAGCCEQVNVADSERELVGLAAKRLGPALFLPLLIVGECGDVFGQWDKAIGSDLPSRRGSKLATC